MASKPPRRHHYTPRFYLQNFTDTDGRLHIISSDTGKRWISTPEGTCFEKDFYKVDEVPAGEDPYMIEKLFADFEGRASAVLGEIITNAPTVLASNLASPAGPRSGAPRGDER